MESQLEHVRVAGVPRRSLRPRRRAATAAPARATDLSGLPPAFVSVGAVDGFCDEDVDYALRLNHAGVPTELHVYPGACHGFNVIAPHARVTKQCVRDMEDWLARQFRVG